jgi:hypothetical protein
MKHMNHITFKDNLDEEITKDLSYVVFVKVRPPCLLTNRKYHNLVIKLLTDKEPYEYKVTSEVAEQISNIYKKYLSDKQI